MKTKFKFYVSLFLGAFLIILFTRPQGVTLISTSFATRLPQLVTVFVSVVIQALPFVLIGVFGSALLQNLITVEMIEAKLSRTKRLSGIFFAIGAGFCFPVCDCGVIPVVRRLLVKRVPPYMAMAFLVTAPLVNPITIWATATAFSYNLTVTVIRVGMAVLVGVLVALLVSKVFPKAEDLFRSGFIAELETAVNEPPYHCGCNHTATPHTDTVHNQSVHKSKGILFEVFNHANEEFLEVGKFLVIGALIAATLQTYFPKQTLMLFTENPMISVLVMMAMALVLSLCAEADAFVARSFTYHFSLGSVMAFMVFGQMFDLKNTALLLKSFKPKAVFSIVAICAVAVFLLCSLLNLLTTNGWMWGRF